MVKFSPEALGTQPIGKLLIGQAIPASIGILVMSINILIDTIFVGNWIGAVAIAAINVVLPVSFFIAALGMAIGVGGSSIISRALGANNPSKALRTFGNQTTLTLFFSITLVVLGLVYLEALIPAFGGKGALYEPAKTYYITVLYGIPFLALCMMGNTVIRAEGKPRFAMYAMVIPAVGNLFLDVLFIRVFDMGMQGAAIATTGSYLLCFSYIFWFFRSGNTALKLRLSQLRLHRNIVAEIGALGFVTLSRQAMVSITYLFMNTILFDLGGETSVTAYAIVSRMLMFALFPVFGIAQGFLPIAGYNYGAGAYQRVRKVIFTAVIYASVFATVVFLILMIFPKFITTLFTNDPAVIAETPNAMQWVFAATPIIALQLIGATYFQAIGKAIPALLLTLTRQGIFFIPLLFILPKYYGELGVWMTFPIADVLSTIVTGYFLSREIRLKLYLGASG